MRDLWAGFNKRKYALYALGIACAALLGTLAIFSRIALFVLICIAAALYGVALTYDAKVTVAQYPRKEMFLCDKHGPLPISATMTLFNGEDMETVSEDGRTKRGPVRCCPICFENAIKVAKQNAGG